MLKSFSTALSFLTVIRLPFTPPILSGAELAESFSCFPLAGLVLGAAYCAVALALRGLVPLPIHAVLVCTLMVVLTRGLHLDGLADLADGLWGGATPERRLEIMKDSRTGSFGVLALILAICLKISSIYGLLSANALAPLLLAPVFARFAMVATAYGSSYARREGLGRPFLENMKTNHLARAALFCAVAAGIAGPLYLLYFVPVLGSVFFIRSVSTGMIGGITGDVLGAVNEVNEILVLVLGACLARA